MTFYPCAGDVTACVTSIRNHYPKVSKIYLMESAGQQEGVEGQSYNYVDCAPDNIPEEFKTRMCEKLGDPEDGFTFYLYLK